MKTAQIGAAGVLLVQYELLKQGIDSAPMTTDSGIDLVLFAPRAQRPMTVQVKTNEKPKRAGGRGPLQLNFWLPRESPAALVGLVHLATNSAWLMTHDEFISNAQQTNQPLMQFYMYTDPNYAPRMPRSHERDFGAFLIQHRIPLLNTL